MKDKYKKQQKKNEQRPKGERRTEARVKGWELNDFVLHLSILQLICKASLIFKSDLELALSIILKQRDYMNRSMFQKSVDF